MRTACLHELTDEQLKQQTCTDKAKQAFAELKAQFGGEFGGALEEKPPQKPVVSPLSAVQSLQPVVWENNTYSHFLSTIVCSSWSCKGSRNQRQVIVFTRVEVSLLSRQVMRLYGSSKRTGRNGCLCGGHG